MTYGISRMPRPVVLSILERLEADAERTGRGIVIGFVDSGFYPHPDLMRPDKRVVTYADATQEDPDADDFLMPRPASWHGTMTACAAAGNGYLSGGRYRGLASDAKVVLVKCADRAGRLTGAHLAHAIRFPLRHPEVRLRVLNVSVGVERDDPHAADVLQAVHEVVRAGVTVIVAAGNRDGAPPDPPASSPDAITVGGWNDGNTRDPGDDTLFPGNYGDGKPDLLAPAIWLPAPMLPGTFEAREAASLFSLLTVLEERLERADLDPRRHALSERDRLSIDAMLDGATARIQHQKFITVDYQHVEGTSFAAPITTSVAAQMLEVDPTLTPRLIREGLRATARRVEGLDPALQGAGLIEPLAAVRWADEHRRSKSEPPAPIVEGAREHHRRG